MNVHTPIDEPVEMIGTTPSAAGDTPFNPERAERAFQHVADLEDDLNRVKHALRMLTVMDFGDVCPDDRDALAILEMLCIANEALERIWEKRSDAWNELHPFAYPHRHGWRA